MFPYHSIHKCTWTSPDGKTSNQIDHTLTDRLCHSSILDTPSFRADYHTDLYLVVAKIRKRLTVNIQGSHRFHMESFNLKKLNKAEGIKKYCVDVPTRVEALKDLDAEVEINAIWETFRESMKLSGKEILGYYELKQHKTWFEEGCSRLLDQRK
jgi:hypothetical protein